MTTLNVLRQMQKTYKLVPNFERTLQHLEILSADNGQVQCTLPVKEEHLNLRGFLHGGFTATLVDNVTTFALASCENPQFGVSVDLNVSYLASAKQGDTLTIDARVVKKGKTLGFTTCDIKKQDGVLIATGTHTKFMPE